LISREKHTSAAPTTLMYCSPRSAGLDPCEKYNPAALTALVYFSQ
jgi:hypothetical protein